MRKFDEFHSKIINLNHSEFKFKVESTEIPDYTKLPDK